MQFNPNHKEVLKLRRFLQHIQNADGKLVVIPLHDKYPLYLSLIDYKLHALTADTSPEIVLDMFCNYYRMEGEEELMESHLFIHLTPN